MSQLTHKMLASNGRADNSIMGLQNSVGPCAWIFFPMNETVGATSLEDIGADALAKTVVATTGTQGKASSSDAAGAPDSGTVPQGITSSQTALIFMLADTSGAGTDYLFHSLTIGAITAGFVLNFASGCSYGDGASNTLGIPSLKDVQVDGLGVAILVNADDSNGDTIARLYGYDPTNGIYTAGDAVTDAGRATIDPTNVLGWNSSAKPTYCFGMVVFDGAPPSTWQADLAAMFARCIADPTDKRLPSNWVTLGTAAA